MCLLDLGVRIRSTFLGLKTWGLGFRMFVCRATKHAKPASKSLDSLFRGPGPQGNADDDDDDEVVVLSALSSERSFVGFRLGVASFWGLRVRG